MLRPLLAFLTLAVAAFVITPTVATVGKGVEDLHIDRPMPWSLWKWYEIPPPEDILPPDCDYERLNIESEVTEWPARIDKNTTFRLAGHAWRVDTKTSTAGIKVDLFLNETKEEPGIPLGTAETDSNGKFVVSARIPQDLGATKYHLVAHSLEKQVGCRIYKESWSDPEMEVTARTRIVLDLPERVVVGNNLTFVARVLDEVGGPVRLANVTLDVNGTKLKVVTDSAGEYRYDRVVNGTDDIEVRASFAATQYYGASTGEGLVKVVPEDVVLGDFRFVRSRENEIAGRVFLAPTLRGGNLTLTFEGTRVASCPTCAPASTLTVPTDAEGSFTAKVFVPPTETPGTVRFTVSGGGLKDAYPFNGTLHVPVTMVVEGGGAGYLSRDYQGTARLVDDAGSPVTGDVTYFGPDEMRTGPTDAQGVFTVEGRASCGFHDVTASYPGDATRLSTSAQGRMGVCGPLAYLPQWILDTPPWIFALALALATVAILAARAARVRYAPTLSRGPPLRLAITEPRDHAPDVVSVGETLRATAYLDDPLPAGHVLRMGTHRHMEPRLVGDDLRATFEFTPTKLGDTPLRAEVLDARGRIVTRRTVHVRCVKYAAEVERRYRALKAEHAGDEADVVTPREFEAWLHERAPGLDPALTRKLVSIFEEADYGPRETGREAFLAYLEAEQGLPEVTPRAA